MAPPSATQPIETGASVPTNDYDGVGTATHEPGLTKTQAEKQVTMPKFPGPPKFVDKYQEREYQKGRLALAFRIFAKLGFDEGVAGHITLRVSGPFSKIFIYFKKPREWGRISETMFINRNIHKCKYKKQQN